MVTIYELGFILVLFVAQPGPMGGQPAAYSIDLETELREYLYTGYSVLQRPSNTVNVRVSLNLLYLNGLDIKSQTMSTSGFFKFSWTDGRLKWNTNSTYDNVRLLFSNEIRTWRPSIVIENSNQDLAIFSDPQSMIRIRSDGMLTWNPGGLFETHCDADVTYYPLDTQECSIVLTTWAFTLLETKLDFDIKPYVLDSFKENGEWEIVGTSTRSENIFRAGDVENSFTRLYFTFKLKRRPLFHILNTLFPVILMAFLICFVFKLPPDSGERVGMSLTVLLAYAVYLTLIAENIPQTSLRASVLSTYLTIILMLSALSVIFTIVVLDIYFNHEDDEEIPDWVQKLTKVFLVRIACWKGIYKCCKKKVKPKRSDDNVVVVDSNMALQSMEFSTVAKKKTAFDTTSTQSTSTYLDPEVDDDDEKLSWKEVALVLDKCLMYMFVGCVVLCTVVCVCLLASQS